MKFNEVYNQLNESLSDQPIFVHDNGAYNRWARIRNAKLTSNETIEIHLEDGTRIDMALNGPNPNYRLILNDGTLTDAYTVAGIYGLLQAPKIISEDDGGGGDAGGGGDIGGGSMDAGTPMSSVGLGDGSTTGDHCHGGPTDGNWYTHGYGYGIGMRGPVFLMRAQPLAGKQKRKRVETRATPPHHKKKKNTALKV